MLDKEEEGMKDSPDGNSPLSVFRMSSKRPLRRRARPSTQWTMRPSSSSMGFSSRLLREILILASPSPPCSSPVNGVLFRFNSSFYYDQLLPLLLLLLLTNYYYYDYDYYDYYDYYLLLLPPPTPTTTTTTITTTNTITTTLSIGKNPKPGVFDLKGRYKWDAWAELKGLGSLQFIASLISLPTSSSFLAGCCY